MARGGPRINIDSSFNERGVRDAERSMSRLGKTGNKVFSGLKVGALAAGAAVGDAGDVGAA